MYAQYKIPSIGFFDDNGEMVSCYDPEGYGLEVNLVERTLLKGEELVGIYGVKDRQKWFTSLGFIVLKKLPPNFKAAKGSVTNSQKNLNDFTNDEVNP